MMTLERSFLSAINSGLTRARSQVTSVWAQNYVVLGQPIPGPMNFKHHPWSREWCDENGDWVGMKCSQVAMTHAAIMRAMKTNDIDQKNVLYLMPKMKPDAADFSKTKFDVLLETSPYLKDLYQDTKNVGLKQAGSAFFILRGAKSRSALKNISVALKVFDEYDEMPQANITLAEERSNAYVESQTIKLSTPTAPDYGIDKEFQHSTKEQYIFRCPCCSRRVFFVFPQCLVIQAKDSDDSDGLRASYLICPECKNRLEHEAKFEFLAESNGAKWESPEQKKADVRGFYLNQFYSITVPPWKLAKKKLKADESNEPLDEKEWWNSSGGLPHLVAGAKIPEEIVSSLAKNYRNNDKAAGVLTTMGIDPGKHIHVQIVEWYFPKGITANINADAESKIIHLIELESFGYLYHLMRDYQVFMAVIDGQYDHRMCIEFARTFFGHVYLAYTTQHARGKEMRIDDNELTITVNRTSWLDASQGRFRRGATMLPGDYPRSYPKHISALIREPIRDRHGRPDAIYKSTGADHYAFANLYNEIALPLAVSVQSNTDITKLLG